MCEQCTAGVEEHGEFMPGWFLVRAFQDGNEMKKGDWGLVECNDPTVIIPFTPVADPFFRMTVEQEEKKREDHPETKKQNEVFLEQLGELDELLCMPPYDGHLLYEGALKAGYTQDDGSIGCWLLHHLATYIASDHPVTHNTTLRRANA